MKKITLLFLVLIFSTLKLSAQVYGWGEVGASSDSIFNGPIIATVADAQNNIYAAGEFFDSNGNYYVAKWNGLTWNRLGTGANALNANSWILDMVIDTFGNIYVSGFFKNSANQYYIAKWNGVTWSALNVTIPSYTYAGYRMAVDLAGNLYTSVYSNSNPTINEVAKWNGTTWSVLGVGSTLLNANDQIFALASDANGNIYAAGKFTDSLNTLVGNLYVAKWNGTNWGSLTSSTSYLQGLSRSIGITNILPDVIGNIYIHCSQSIYKWNGINWAILDSNYFADGGYYHSMCTDTFNNLYSLDMINNDCAKWNGTNWVDLTGNNPALALHPYSSLSCVLSDKKNDIYLAAYVLNSKGSFYLAKFGLQNCISYFTVDYDTAINTFNIITDTSITTKMATSYHWDFGDGSSSNLQFPTHVYLVDTVYNVCLTIKTSTGDSCTYCHTIGKDYQGNIIKSGGFNLNVKGQSNIGVNEMNNEQAELMVYPNPVNNVLICKYANVLMNTIEIRNVIGQLMCANSPLQRGLGGFEINVSNFPSGVYFIKATDDKGNSYNAKFVKE